jgi:formylglycine-generating enzyme required for sulfatase activity
MNRIRTLSATLAARLRGIAIAAAAGLLSAPAVANPPCPSDIDGSNTVDFGDVALILIDFGACAGCATDLDGTGAVDHGDVALALLEFGLCATWFTVLEETPDPAVVYDAGLRAAITTTGLPWRVRDNGTGIEMVLIPPGSHTMGCSASSDWDCMSDESPTHQVTLTQAFYLSRTEVTQAQWVARVGSNPSRFQSASSAVPASEVPNRPVERVSWNEIQTFCTAADMRLPTEAEWEYAYRAGTTTAFHGWPANPNGTNDDGRLETIAWFGSNSSSQTRPVGGKAANGFGLFDMAGNVWEFCLDWYDDYASGAQTNPMGPATGFGRVMRGGDWNLDSNECRASNRSLNAPGSRGSHAGFRVARTP